MVAIAFNQFPSSAGQGVVTSSGRAGLISRPMRMGGLVVLSCWDSFDPSTLGGLSQQGDS